MASTKLAITDLLSLPNSQIKIPRLGFGVYLSHNKQCVTSCLAALNAGYRYLIFSHIIKLFSAKALKAHRHCPVLRQ